MRKHISFLITLCIFTALSSFSQSNDKTVSLLQHDKDTEYLIHLKKVKERLSLKISDFATDFKFVRLETRKECLLGEGTYYVTNEYILVEKPKHGILQFDSNGKFIRTLVKTGQGPKEYLMLKWAVDEENQILYLNDYTKNGYILSYDLHSGEYRGDIRKAIPGVTVDIRLLEDNSLLLQNGAYAQNDQEKCLLYYQDLSGKLLKRVNTPKEMFFSLQSNKIINQFPPFRYFVRNLDTVFTINDNKMIPFLVFDYGEPNPPGINTAGHKSMFINHETSQWVFFYKFFITKDNVKYATIGDADYYLLDKKKNKVFLHDYLYIDPLHHLMSSSKTEFIQFQSNGIIQYDFQALDLIELTKLALADPEFTEPYRSKLEELVKDLDEEDNPVLLIGRYEYKMII